MDILTFFSVKGGARNGSIGQKMEISKKETQKEKEKKKCNQPDSWRYLRPVSNRVDEGGWDGERVAVEGGILPTYLHIK